MTHVELLGIDIRLEKGSSEQGPTRVADRLAVDLRLMAISELEIVPPKRSEADESARRRH